MAYQKILVEREDGIVIIKLNDPDVMNAMDDQMLRELGEELDRTEADSGSRVIVLTGMGRAFSSGYDMRLMKAEGREPLALTEDHPYQARIDPSAGRVLPYVIRFRNFDRPIIAAVNGYALGGGLGLALACDIRIASEQAKFSFLFTKRGLTPYEGSSYLLPYIVGISKALELAFTGDMIDGREAERIGLVSKVVPPEELIPVTMDLARKIGKNPPIAIGLSKYVMHKALQMDIYDGMFLAKVAHLESRATQDHQEAIRAYVEKRGALFRGK